MSLKEEDPPMMASDSASPSSGAVDKSMTQLAGQLVELANDYLDLATLETRLTVTTALGMLIMAIMTAIVLVSTWLALVGAAVVALIGLGLAPALAMLLLAAVNLVFAVVGWWRIRHMRHSLGWPATQRAIKQTVAEDQRGGE